MGKIRIIENTSIEDIDGWFDIDNVGENITFEILLKSSFQVFAEGVALGALSTLVANGKKIKLQFYKNPDINADWKIDNIHPILSTIFGLELLRLSEAILDSQGDALQEDSIISIGEKIWEHALGQGGYLGDGKRSHLISRHDYLVPQRIRHSETSSTFPRYDYFRSSITKFLLGLRGCINPIGQHEGMLIEWLHHIAENAYEHGSFSFQNKGFVEGFSGIILEKYIFKNTDELEKRNDCPKYIKEYIKKLVSQAGRSHRTFTFNYVSVVDRGDGIQNTLQIENTTDLQRLGFSFKNGVTRKSQDTNENSGYGLGRALGAATKLGAFLHISSGNIIASIDLSGNDKPHIKQGGEVDFTKQLYLKKKFGTSISIFWMSE